MCSYFTCLTISDSLFFCAEDISVTPSPLVVLRTIVLFLFFYGRCQCLQPSARQILMSVLRRLIATVRVEISFEDIFVPFFLRARAPI